MVELLILLWQPMAEERCERGGAAVGAAGGGAALAEEGLLGWRSHVLVRVAMCVALLVAIVLMLTRPRQRAEFADLMVWARMGGQRWERSELGAAGVHLDRWPLATRRGEERERWRQLRPPPRRVRSEGALCAADIVARLTRTPRLRSCRTV